VGALQAQRIQIARSMPIEFKKELAKMLAGIDSASPEEITDDLSRYMAVVRNRWKQSRRICALMRAT
jgi:4-hydroxybutyryl-CoA dehydratase / vinylacetyl-CoA-Delta-isomerase